ncbi:MAG: sodium-translocating pyrophosphatase, partial [Rickettsiales bacterium]|nr:sodium-translocating pyrophosphatase [Rickettsiales bacterium]
MDLSASYQMALACFVVALLYAIVSARHMLDASSGTEKMRDVANAIKQGAQAYFKRQYRTIAIVSIAIAALLAWQLGWLIAVSFLLGGMLSSLASFI